MFRTLKNIASVTVSLTVMLISVTAAETSIRPGAIEMDKSQNVDAVPGDVIELEDSENKSEFIIAPLPSHDALFGWSVSVPLMFMYKPDFTTPDDQTWVSGLVGFYAENDSWGAGGFHKMSVGGDKWRLKGALFHADMRYDYFGIGGDPDISVPLHQPLTIALAEALREVVKDFYLGLRISFIDTDASIDSSGGFVPPEPVPPDINVDYSLVTLAPSLQFDTRDDQFYPTSGYFIEGQVALGREWLGSDTEYEKYELDVNHYLKFGKSGVIGLRGIMQYAGGDAPFFVFPAYGANVDLRGYKTGSYRDRFLFATQAEYRHRFTQRIGAVVFAGIGTVADEFASWDETLPSAGVGFRFVLAPKNNVSLRVDYAWGKDDQQFYVGIGESF